MMQAAQHAESPISGFTRNATLANSLISRAVLCAIVLASVAACNLPPSVETMKRQHPPISQSRPLGTACSETDSASVKRAAFHPLGPTGGWYARKPFVDYSRTLDRPTNHLVLGEMITGYVKFPESGYLQSRSYDDYFGDVYCGWSPNKLYLKPTKQHVYVALDCCAVGDGGLDQVHEVCWFPDGKSEGVLIFSTAHPSPEPKLRPADLYQRAFLGNQYQFDQRMFTELMTDDLQQGDLTHADLVCKDALTVLGKMRDGVDGSTRKPIAAKELHHRDWLAPLAYRAGLCIGEPCFGDALQDLESTTSGTSLTGARYDDQAMHDMVPLYKWLDQAIRSKTVVPLTGVKSTQRLYGHDPELIAGFVQPDLKLPPPPSNAKRYKGEVSSFWRGVKAYLRHDYPVAQQRFEQFLHNERHGDTDAFEVAVAAKLRDKLLKHSTTKSNSTKPAAKSDK